MVVSVSFESINISHSYILSYLLSFLNWICVLVMVIFDIVLWFVKKLGIQENVRDNGRLIPQKNEVPQICVHVFSHSSRHIVNKYYCALYLVVPKGVNLNRWKIINLILILDFQLLVEWLAICNVVFWLYFDHELCYFTSMHASYSRLLFPSLLSRQCKLHTDGCSHEPKWPTNSLLEQQFDSAQSWYVISYYLSPRATF